MPQQPPTDTLATLPVLSNEAVKLTADRAPAEWWLNPVQWTKDQAWDKKVPGIFTGHRLPAGDLKPIIHYRDYDKDWQMPVFLTGLLVVALVRLAFGKRFKQLFKGFLQLKTTREIVREENTLFKQSSVLLISVFLLNFSVLVFQIFEQNGISGNFDLSGFPLFVFIVLASLVYYSVKVLLIRILGFVFDAAQESRDYVFNLFIVKQVAGLALFPSLLLLTLGNEGARPQLLLMASVTFTAFFIYRVLRGQWLLYAQGGFSKSYLFFYLCGLEILPLLIIGKLIAGMSN